MIRCAGVGICKERCIRHPLRTASCTHFGSHGWHAASSTGAPRLSTLQHQVTKVRLLLPPLHTLLLYFASVKLNTFVPVALILDLHSPTRLDSTTTLTTDCNDCERLIHLDSSIFIRFRLLHSGPVLVSFRRAPASSNTTLTLAVFQSSPTRSPPGPSAFVDAVAQRSVSLPFDSSTFVVVAAASRVLYSITSISVVY